ncbi:MAG: hypothetical protein NC180_12965 [Muribaculaceae bacterium]|nr:hypothetical protein [Muribaculaceae bacterium]
MGKRKLSFPDYSRYPDREDIFLDKVVKNAADLYLEKVATENQKNFIAANWTVMLPIMDKLITTGILQGWELRGMDCKDCPLDKDE